MYLTGFVRTSSCRPPSATIVGLCYMASSSKNLSVKVNFTLLHFKVEKNTYISSLPYKKNLLTVYAFLYLCVSGDKKEDIVMLTRKFLDYKYIYIITRTWATGDWLNIYYVIILIYTHLYNNISVLNIYLLLFHFPFFVFMKYKQRHIL